MQRRATYALPAESARSACLLPDARGYAFSLHLESRQVALINLVSKGLPPTKRKKCFRLLAY